MMRDPTAACCVQHCHEGCLIISAQHQLGALGQLLWCGCVVWCGVSTRVDGLGEPTGAGTVPASQHLSQPALLTHCMSAGLRALNNFLKRATHA
jgi:hypothetical protein